MSASCATAPILGEASLNTRDAKGVVVVAGAVLVFEEEAWCAGECVGGGVYAAVATLPLGSAYGEDLVERWRGGEVERYGAKTYVSLHMCTYIYRERGLYTIYIYTMQCVCFYRYA